MSNVISIKEFQVLRSKSSCAKRRSPSPSPSVSFWEEAADDLEPELLLEQPDGQIAATLVKGLFAIYHLTREHKRQRRELPGYLYAFALEFAVPIIPTAEGLYERHFGEPRLKGGRDIPDDLLELGRGTVDNFSVCVAHARQMHRLLIALASHEREAMPLLLRISGALRKKRSARLLVALVTACCQWESKQSNLKLV